MAISHVLFTAKPGYGPLAWLSSLVAWAIGYLFNLMYTDAVAWGRVAWPFQFLLWAVGWSKHIRRMKGSVDVLGVNHYYRSEVSFEWDLNVERKASVSDLFLRFPGGLLLTASAMPGFEKNDMGWDLTPSSMETLLLYLWERYHMPMIVTESGICDGEEPDDRRTRYLSAVLGVADRLVARGVDLKGYLLWSLLDNFEWAEGFGPRFGLIKVDYKTQKRSGRPSNKVVRNATGAK